VSPAAYRAKYAIMQHRAVCRHMAMRNPAQAHRAHASYEDYIEALADCPDEERKLAFDAADESGVAS
jgi:hypothetical protein